MKIRTSTHYFSFGLFAGLPLSVDSGDGSNSIGAETRCRALDGVMLGYYIGLLQLGMKYSTVRHRSTPSCRKARYIPTCRYNLYPLICLLSCMLMISFWLRRL